MKQILLTLILATLVFVGSADTVLAARYKVTPRVIDREVDRRDIFSETVTIENLEPFKIKLYASVNEIATDGSGDIIDFVPRSMDHNKGESITSWIAVTRGVIEILPGETAEVPISFQINKDAKPGNYQAFIGFGMGHTQDVARKQVEDGQAPGVTVTLAVEQNQTEFLRLDGFSVDRFVIEPENNAISYTLKNPGEAPVVPKGEIIFYSGRGTEVAAVQVNPNQESLIPGQETTLKATVPIDGMLGKYKAFLSIDYGTAQVASVYDTTFFYVLPWQKLLIIFVVVLVLAMSLTLFLHRRMKVVAVDQHDGHSLPLHVYEGHSEPKDHDINLK